MAYELVEKKVVFEGKKVRLELHRLSDGHGGEQIREVFAHPGAVVILPMLDAETVVLIRNRRWAVGQMLVELPAGTLEKGEDPAVCAGRELIEETGYRAGRIEALGWYFTSPGILSEKMYAFAAYDLMKTSTALEEGEEVEAFQLPIRQALGKIQSGEIVDGKTIATLLMYDRFHLRPG